jgi:hypothetical protein
LVFSFFLVWELLALPLLRGKSQPFVAATMGNRLIEKGVSSKNYDLQLIRRVFYLWISGD